MNEDDPMWAVLFIDFKDAYNSVDRKELFNILEDQ
jgi:hypothetical protein